MTICYCFIIYIYIYILLLKLFRFIISCFSIVIDVKLKNLFGKIWLVLIEVDFSDSDYSLNPHRSTWKKILMATLLFVNFSKASDSMHRKKMEQILRAFGLHKETVPAVTMFYKKHASNDSYTWWRHRFLSHCHCKEIPYLYIICHIYI